ncbi:hypothetical protein KSF_085600 [Reticulibacter mediterranei]|uniref:Uncharacterized protein n=1 Tax=Reticulibacter mediterranei TaxID=2778369 RepID=A0A8J3N4S1_9CHLR|nr:hypothetical protein KSF_085600 [Reticulibacter mediterranei]
MLCSGARNGETSLDHGENGNEKPDYRAASVKLSDRTGNGHPGDAGFAARGRGRKKGGEER